MRRDRGVRQPCAPRGGTGGLSVVCACLLTCVALHAAAATAAAPCVRLTARNLRLTHAGELRVELTSADGRAHHVALHVTHDLGGLRPQPAIVDVPAEGSVHADVLVLRGDAAWSSRHAIDVVALDGERPLGLASAVVEVAPDPALVPRLRPLLIGLGLVLLAVALVQEWRRETAP